MNIKMTTNSQLSTTKRQKQTKQTTRTGTDHMEGYQGRRRRMGEKVQGIRSINGRYKIDRERLRIV